jgi:hypothetical protein
MPYLGLVEDRAMMVAPFVSYAIGIALALAGRERSALVALVVALILTAAMFFLHATDSLPISL